MGGVWNGLGRGRLDCIGGWGGSLDRRDSFLRFGGVGRLRRRNGLGLFVLGA